MPPGSANLILSLVGTTSIGFNLFLGSSIAEGKELAASQRGIAFSVFSAFIVSVLIMIVGDGVTRYEKKWIPLPSFFFPQEIRSIQEGYSLAIFETRYLKIIGPCLLACFLCL